MTSNDIYCIMLSDSTEVDIINRAVSNFNSLLSGCIQWVPWQNEDDFVMFTNEMAGCMATTGREGGMQVLNLQPFPGQGGTCFAG